jgi:Uri superfamily endonuclease
MVTVSGRGGHLLLAGDGPASPPPGSGVYVLLLRLKDARALNVGRLGLLRFPAGWYGYVGSAQRNLLGRLRRHARRTKPLHWHIDRLTREAAVMGAWVFPAEKSAECRLAAALARAGERVPAKRVWGFGASDCRCGGHLVRFARRSEVEEAVKSLGRSGRRGRGEAPVLTRGWLRSAEVRFLGKRELTGLGAPL